MKRRRFLAGLRCIAVLPLFVRIHHVNMDWGEYWSIEFVAPWR